MIEIMFAVIILLVWCFIVILINWNNKITSIKNLLYSIEIVLMLGLIYWIPFWLIFLK